MGIYMVSIPWFKGLGLLVQKQTLKYKVQLTPVNKGTKYAYVEIKFRSLIVYPLL